MQHGTTMNILSFNFFYNHIDFLLSVSTLGLLDISYHLSGDGIKAMFIFISILKLRCGLIKVNQTVGYIIYTFLLFSFLFFVRLI
jgi:hypothetical protein